MALIFANVYEPYALDDIRAQMAVNGLVLRLYKNNYTPVDGSVIGDFAQCDFSGYSSVVPTFGAPAEVAGKASMNDTSVRSFTHNGGATANTVYGYYVTDTTVANLVYAERFGAPITMSANGDLIQIQLFLTLDSANH